jgi:hypothetical protein
MARALIKETGGRETGGGVLMQRGAIELKRGKKKGVPDLSAFYIYLPFAFLHFRS